MAAGSRRLRPADAVPEVLVLVGAAIFVAVVYIAVVRGGGALIGRTDSPSLVLSVVATAIVAFGFQPICRRLRPVAVRLARRERSAPYEVLSRFVDEVASPRGADDVPARMARLLAEATDAGSAQVWLTVDGTPLLAATWPAGADGGDGPPRLDPVDAGRPALPVRHGDDLLGVLVVRTRDRQPLTPMAERLFADLAAQAGLVLRAVRLRTELAVRLRETSQRARELRASRVRIIAAEDEERRRLERDIHDGAQQHLVALAVSLRLARTLVLQSPQRAPALLSGLTRVAEDAIDTLADLSRGIHPRLLSEQGLAAALAAAVAAGPAPVALAVEEMARPRADVEAALYFCCVEALQNASKHSGATSVVVRVRRTADEVELVVSDDGAGFAPGGAGTGSGLANIRDRAASVGGHTLVDSRPGRGTRITVRVPWIPPDSGGG